jgi:hypothetical protein
VHGPTQSTHSVDIFLTEYDWIPRAWPLLGLKRPPQRRKYPVFHDFCRS